MYFVILSNIISGILISIYAVILIFVVINKFKNNKNITENELLVKENNEKDIHLNCVVIDILD